MENCISTIIEHVSHLFLVGTRTFGSETAFLDDHGVKFKFEGLAFDHLLFHCILSDETEYLYDFLLANPVSSVHGLEIYLRVPVAVV